MIIIKEDSLRLKGILKLQSSEFSCLQESNIVIDTGCMRTRLNFNDLLTKTTKDKKIIAMEQKKKDIEEYRKGNLRISFSKGVNDVNTLGLKRFMLKDEEILNNPSIGFIHTFKDFSINGTSFGERNVRVFYNSKTSLLGMDILKDLYWRYENGLFFMDFKSIDISNMSECSQLIRNLLNQKNSLKCIKEEVEKKYPGFPVEAIMFDLLEDTYLVPDEGEV